MSKRKHYDLVKKSELECCPIYMSHVCAKRNRVDEKEKFIYHAQKFGKYRYVFWIDMVLFVEIEPFLMHFCKDLLQKMF